METWVQPQYLFVPSILLFALFIFRIVTSPITSPKKNLPPSPPKLPIIGNLHQLSFHDFSSLRSLAKKHGPVVLIKMGSRTALLISSAEAAEDVLRKHDLSFAERPRVNLARRFGYGFRDLVLAPYGEYWRQTRGICVSQLLSNQRVSSFRHVREEEIARALEAIKESCSSSSTCNMSEIFANLSYNVFFRSAMGKGSSSKEENGTWFKALLGKADKLAFALIGEVFPWLGWINHFNGVEGKVRRICKEVDGFLECIIEEAIKRSRECADVQDDCKNFVDVLIQCQREEEEDSGATTLHRDSIKALIVDMIFAGTDPTHSLFEWTFSELMRNLEVMSKLQNDVRNISGDLVMITQDDLGKLPYLKAVIREALRMHPPFEIIARASREAVRIQTYDVEPDTMVLIDVKVIGRDPEMWEDPNEFRPERFLVENPVDIKGQHFQYLPFGSGRRSCPGSGASLLIVELAIANLVRDFSFTLPDGAKPEDLDMTEKHGLTCSRKVPLLLVPALN